MTDTNDDTPITAEVAADGDSGENSPPEANRGETASAEATGDSATGGWQRQLADAEARAAILAAGGNLEVLMPHVREAIRLNQSADGISLSCQDGDETVSLNAFVDGLRHKDGFADAFSTATSTQSPPAQEVRGSGASGQTSPRTQSIDPGNPLAIGQSLVDIASGKIHISFS